MQVSPSGEIGYHDETDGHWVALDTVGDDTVGSIAFDQESKTRSSTPRSRPTS